MKYLRRMDVGRHLFLSILALFLLFLSTASAFSADNSNVEVQTPDVMVLISYKGLFGDIGTIAYPREVKAEQVRADLQRMLDGLGWRATDVKITTEGKMQSGADRPMTAVEFIHWGNIDLPAGRLPVEPIILALRSYKRPEIVFMLPSDFVYRGAQQYENKNVAISYEHAGDLHRFSVRIKDPNFDKLTLPDPSSAAQPVQQQTKNGGSNTFQIILIVLLALILAFVAYVVARSMCKDSGRPSN